MSECIMQLLPDFWHIGENIDNSGEEIYEHNENTRLGEPVLLEIPQNNRFFGYPIHQA